MRRLRLGLVLAAAVPLVAGLTAALGDGHRGRLEGAQIRSPSSARPSPRRALKWYIAEDVSVSGDSGSSAARRMADAAVHAATMLGWLG